MFTTKTLVVKLERIFMNKDKETKDLFKSQLSRRKLLKAGLLSLAGLSVASYEMANSQQDSTILNPTNTCDDGDDITISQTAGPFYTPDTPEHTSFLEESITGTKLIVMGKVLTTNCQPITSALLDFWHTNANGEYDNVGYKLRGHQFTDAEGNYRLETIVPGLYPGRTRHIHVRAQRANGNILTTQLYFPNESLNARDGIFDDSLLMEVSNEADGSKTALFNFVLR